MINKNIFLYSLLAIVSCKKEQIIPVKVDYNYTVNSKSNYTVPVKVNFKNESKGATKYRWTFEGGIPASSTQKNPGTITFNDGGAHTITLEAWNEDDCKSTSRILQLDHAVTIDFETEIPVNNFAPADVRIVNKTIGASTYQWTFEGSDLASSTAKDPAPVRFNQPGTCTITLIASNGRTNFTSTKKITLLPPLHTSFKIAPSLADQEWHAPVKAHLQNESVSGLHWEWTVKAKSGEGPNGGLISHPTEKNTDIDFPHPGTYTVSLTANNGKKSETVHKEVTIRPNTNLLSFSNVSLGINTSLTHPVFFSTKLRRGFKTTDDLSSVAPDIDIVFYGQTSDFNLNRFLCPSPLGDGRSVFNAIPNANTVAIANVQRSTSENLSASDFDGIETDDLLRKINIEEHMPQIMDRFSDQTAPYVILFRTSDGRKGAINVKRFVREGLDSYIVVDIKVQKTPRS